ncbi:DUF3397 domain-containing protein [Cohnella abietis]|uniref:DUF3397 domain-containing protein n=1 Tax=Cohnella abietis TaxID=2507935 RepID=A0A3T1D9E1_9BACL|nr:DUF3397 domain-containing protein [Cohnella abietis]BBI34689.1 hypothetical protein KCTCHS21_40880 [Cohnella abietis]
MGPIWKSLAQSYAYLATIPFIPFLLVYFVSYYRRGDRKRAIRLAMDVTNVFLIGYIAMLINLRLNTGFGLFFIFLLMLIGAGLIGNAQNRMNGKVDINKVTRAIWRISFFGLAFLYIPLTLLELFFPSG